MSSPAISVRFAPPLREQLTGAARAERRSVSAMVRVLCEDGLAARGREHAEQTLRELGYAFREGSR